MPAPSFRPVVGPTIDFPPLYPDQTETSTAGMYIFWDFIIGLPPETTAVRLHSALYNDTYALGRPTSLPVFYTQQLPESSFFPYNMRWPDRKWLKNIFVITISWYAFRIAMMSMMQQIPGCEPSSDLSIVAELHLSIASGPLSSKAWVKIDVFDEKLRVKSGRWRVALKCVPVETSISTTEMQSLNNYHRAELFFRLATHAQAQVEAKQKMNPNYANYYNYLKPTIKLSNSPRRWWLRTLNCLPKNCDSMIISHLLNVYWKCDINLYCIHIFTRWNLTFAHFDNIKHCYIQKF